MDIRGERIPLLWSGVRDRTLANGNVKCLTSTTILVFKKMVMLNMFGNDQNWCVQKNATVKCLTSITIIVSKKMPVLKV